MTAHGPSSTSQLRRPRMLRCHCLPPGSLHVLGAFGSLSKSHISFKHATLSGIKSKRPGENNLKATSANFSTTSARLAAGPLESYSGNVSNQDTTSEQHHSRIEITTKNMIDHMLSEQDFFLVFILVIPGAWSVSKCCPNSIRISSWLRRNSHCGERRSHRALSLGGTARWLQLQPSSSWPRRRKPSKMFSLCTTRITARPSWDSYGL